MRLPCSTLAFAALACATFAAPPLHAQRDEAQRAMEEGVAAAARGDHPAALAHFKEAQRLLPEANLPYRFAAESEEQLGRWEDAVASYESYLRVRPNVKDAAKVRAHLEEIRARHVEGHLDVESTPPGSAVFLDDAAGPAGETPLRDVRVSAGRHTVRVRFLGYRDAVIVTEVAPGARVVLQSVLERVPMTGDPATAEAGPRERAARVGPADAEPAPPTPWHGRWYVWAGAGAIAAGIVTAVVLAARPTPPATQGGTLRFPEGS